jgi:hypothetical protein
MGYGLRMFPCPLQETPPSKQWWAFRPFSQSLRYMPDDEQFHSVHQSHRNQFSINNYFATNRAEEYLKIRSPWNGILRRNVHPRWFHSSMGYLITRAYTTTFRAGSGLPSSPPPQKKIIVFSSRSLLTQWHWSTLRLSRLIKQIICNGSYVRRMPTLWVW